MSKMSNLAIEDQQDYYVRYNQYYYVRYNQFDFRKEDPIIKKRKDRSREALKVKTMGMELFKDMSAMFGEEDTKQQFGIN